MRSVFKVFVLVLLFSVATMSRAQEMLRISRLVMADQVLSNPAAAYPEDAKAAGIEGTVVLDVVISKTGAVEQVVIVSGADKLRDAARDAVSKWTYKPYMLDGVATEVDTTVWVTFSLKDGSSANAKVDSAAIVPDARVVAAPNGTSKAAPAKVSSGITAAMLLHKVSPIYPMEARANHVSGAVIMRAIISKKGTVDRLEVVSGPPMLRDAALDAVRQWTYKPFLLNGQPVDVETMITVNFQDSRVPQTFDPNSGGPYGHQISGGLGPH